MNRYKYDVSKDDGKAGWAGIFGQVDCFMIDGFCRCMGKG